MANQSLFQTATSTKWQTCCGKQTSLSHLDPINPFKQFLSMLHPYLPFFIYFYQSLFIFVLLLDMSGGFWWCEGGIWWPNGWVVVWLWPGTTKWQPYKFFKQAPLQNGNLGPRVVFQLTTLQKQQQHHLQTKAACTHPRDTLKVLDNPAMGKGFASCPLAKECQNKVLKLSLSIKLT